MITVLCGASPVPFAIVAIAADWETKEDVRIDRWSCSREKGTVTLTIDFRIKFEETYCKGTSALINSFVVVFATRQCVSISLAWPISLCGVVGLFRFDAALSIFELDITNIFHFAKIGLPKMSASKVIILTGASRGLGLAIAHYLLKRQHRLVVVARSEQALRQLEQQYSNQVAVLAGDFADLSLGPKAVNLAKEHWKRLDGLIVNHGVLDPVTRVVS